MGSAAPAADSAVRAFRFPLLIVKLGGRTSPHGLPSYAPQQQAMVGREAPPPSGGRVNPPQHGKTTAGKQAGRGTGSGIYFFEVLGGSPSDLGLRQLRRDLAEQREGGFQFIGNLGGEDVGGGQ